MAGAKAGNIQSIQFLRGIAAFMVLLHHLHDIKNIPDSNFVKHCLSYGWMGVNVFFIISGFIIPYSMYIKNYTLADFGNFFIRRITRIEPPYIVSIVLVLLLTWSTTLSPWYKGPAFSIDWGNTLGHLGYLNAFTHRPWLNNAYWTLAIEFEYYIILALIYPLITHRNKVVIAVTFLALLAATFLPVSGSHICHYLPFFLMGIALFLYKTDKIPVAWFLPLTGFAAIVCFISSGPVLTVLSLTVLLCIQVVKKVPKVFMLLGAISYSLYLTHGVLVTRVMGLAERYLHINNPWLLMVIAIICCLVFAWIYYATIEKFFLNLSKKIRYNHPGNAKDRKVSE